MRENFSFFSSILLPLFYFLTISKRARFRPGEPTEWTNFQEAVSAMARDLPAVRKSNFPCPWHEDKLPRTQAAGASSSSSFHPGVAQQGTGAGSQSNSTNAADPCTDTPHCAGTVLGLMLSIVERLLKNCSNTSFCIRRTADAFSAWITTRGRQVLM